MHKEDNSHVTGIPHVYTTLFAIIILAAISTWIIPGGTYERKFNEFGNFSIIPDTFKEIPADPMGPIQMLTTVYKGMISSADTVFFVFVSFASIAVVVSTGAFHALISRLLQIFKGHLRILTIPLFITLIGMASSTVAVFEEIFPFIPLFVAAAIAMKYDGIVGMAMVALGLALGYSGAFLNPFTVGIAQNIAGLPPFSGALYRIFCHVVMIMIASGYVMIYAIRVEHNPEKSLLHGLVENNADMQRKVFEEHPMNVRHIIVLLATAAGICVIIWGVSSRGWRFEQFAAIYFLMAIASGIIMGWPPDKVAHIWAEGAGEITSTCLKIAMAKGVIFILQDARIFDTFINWISSPLILLPQWAGAEAMLMIQTALNFFVPSGYGQAVVSMPVMVPLADILGISRQTAVLAFQFGDGLSNILWLTGTMPIMCKFAKIPPRKWLKWFIPLFCLLLVAQMLLIALALAIEY